MMFPKAKFSCIFLCLIICASYYFHWDIVVTFSKEETVFPVLCICKKEKLYVTKWNPVEHELTFFPGTINSLHFFTNLHTYEDKHTPPPGKQFNILTRSKSVLTSKISGPKTTCI